MLAVYSVENIIAQQMEKYGMAALFLGELAQLYGIPAGQTRLSQALRGAKALPNQVGIDLRQLVQEIADYCDSLDIPVSLTDAVQIKSILDERRELKKIIKDENLQDAIELNDGKQT